uniref:Uncharacterized protein n=1 Tax=Oryza brachyantha TaxID=4533 RepID=J3M7C1_ORYBR
MGPTTFSPHRTSLPLLVGRFNTSSGDPFFPAAARRHYRLALRFLCCLLWVHVDETLLAEYLNR